MALIEEYSSRQIGHKFSYLLLVLSFLFTVTVQHFTFRLYVGYFCLSSLIYDSVRFEGGDPL